MLVGRGAVAQIVDKADCESKCAKRILEFETNCRSTVGSTFDSKGNSAQNDITSCVAQRQKFCETADKCSSGTANQEACTKAKDKYDEANIKSRGACGAFDKTTKKTDASPSIQCAKNVANCRQKMKNLVTPADEQKQDDTKSGTDMLEQIGIAAINKQLGITGVDQNATQTKKEIAMCVKEADSKERKDAKKDDKKEIKDLKKDIKKEYDEQAKLLEKQREKIDEIKKKINEAEADAKKELLKKSTKEREQTNEINKSSIDSAKRLRSYGTSITKEQQFLNKENLNYNKALLDLTSEKVTARCKQEFEALKAGIVNTKINDPTNTSAEQKQLEALAKQFKGSSSGTAKLSELLNLTKKACFEKADSQLKDVNIGNQQNLENINGRIEELQSQIKDEKKTAENNLLAIEAVRKGLTEERAAEEKEKLDKLAALNEEVINFQTSTEEKLKISRSHVQELEDQIYNVKLRTDFDFEQAFIDAEGLIGTAENARFRAVTSCKCPKKHVSGEDEDCSRLRDEQVDLKTKPDAKAKEKTTN